MKTVKEMLNYLQNKETPTPLLSSYVPKDLNLDFWNEYRQNFTNYDKLFNVLYKSFVYFNQDEDESIEDVTNDFTNMVQTYLMANDKRLTELWRINVVPDDDSYSITENYYLEETYSGSNSGNGVAISGQRTDINNLQVGNQNSENVDKVTAFNTSNENVNNSSKIQNGTRNDINQFTQGQQTITNQNANNDSHNMVRHGAIGTMTVTDVLSKQNEFWSNCELFYEFVFKEIYERFLLIC